MFHGGKPNPGKKTFLQKNMLTEFMKAKSHQRISYVIYVAWHVCVNRSKLKVHGEAVHDGKKQFSPNKTMEDESHLHPIKI